MASNITIVDWSGMSFVAVNCDHECNSRIRRRNVYIALRFGSVLCLPRDRRTAAWEYRWLQKKSFCRDVVFGDVLFHNRRDLIVHLAAQ